MKSSSCRPTSKFWTFWGSRDKCWAVNLWAGETCGTLILGSENTETLHLSRNIVSWQVWSTFFNICCGSKKVVAKSRARVYFEHQILALLLVFHQTCNLSWINIKKINQSVHYISSICDKCFCCTTMSWSCEVKKAKQSTQNLQWNNVVLQVQYFCILYFATFIYLLTHFAHAQYGSQMIDRFPWRSLKPESGEIKGICQPPVDNK